MGRTLSQLWRDQSGQSMAEYGLLTALIAIAALVAVRTLGENLRSKFLEMTQAISGVNASGY
ncbi:MAG TPA: Flp family type IVb pilin [Firmicutes bacterium]|nr:Flp family type IVb pilin [Bacillota bacterium]